MRWRTVIRKSAKWGGTIAAVALAAVWVASLWMYIAWRSTDAWCFECTRGRFEVVYSVPFFDPMIPGPGWEIGESSFNNTPLCWWPSYRSNSVRVIGDGVDSVTISPFVLPGGALRLPIWLPFTAALLVAVLAQRADALARHRAGACPSCGYSLAGLTAGSKCPECGKPNLQ